MTLDDLQHDLKMAAVFGLLVLGLMVLVVGVQVGIRQGKALAERPGVRDGGSVSEARPRGSPAGPLSPAEIPALTQQAAASPDDPAWAWLKDEMASDCSPEQVAEAVDLVRVFRQTAQGLTALGETVKSPLQYRQLYGLNALALEMFVSRCLRWMGRL